MILTRLARMSMLLPAVLLLAAGPADDGRWHAGAYSFSDEHGGFRILAASGKGTRSDPIALVQELDSAGSAVLVIRATRRIHPFTGGGEGANGFMHFRIETVNTSGLAWVGFEFELQERLGEPSVYGDGLSFDQRRIDSASIGSDAFAGYDKVFEPSDRLVFSDGKVDPGMAGRFTFLVTDFTPKAIFYLVQDPQIPYS